MRTTVVTPPAPFMAAADVRSRLQLSANVQDATLNAYIAAAVANLDGPNGVTGRALGLQTLQMQAFHFPGRENYFGRRYSEPHYRWRGHHEEILLSYPEIVSVTSVAYIDRTGAAQTLDPSTYIVSGRRIVPAPYNCWPLTQYRPDAVTVVYQAGYQSGAIPANLVQAIALMVATMNAMGRSNILVKQETVIGVSSLQWDTSANVSAVYERAINALLAPLMVYSRDA